MDFNEYDDKKYVESDGRVECLASTDKAVLISIDGDELWFPISQLHEDNEVWDTGDIGTLVCSKWIAQQKEVI